MSINQYRYPASVLITTLVGVMFLLASSAYAQDARRADKGSGSIRVIVDGFKNDRGFAKIGLCNSRESFKNSEELAILFKTTRIVSGKSEHVFPGVPFGIYAVSVYHDENGNGRLDKGLFGKPLELYGFSNNARGVMSRPEYEKAAFVFDKADITVNVTVR